MEYRLRVKSDYANLRSEPRISPDTDIGDLVKGSTFISNEYRDGFYRIEGWIGGATVEIIDSIEKDKPLCELGIDVSQWQKIIKWHEVKSSTVKPTPPGIQVNENGVKFAFIRCGVGSVEGAIPDNRKSSNLTGAKENGIKVAPYIVPRVGNRLVSLEKQYPAFMKLLGEFKKSGCDAIAIDLEPTEHWPWTTSPQELSEEILSWAEKLSNEFNKVIIYTAEWCWLGRGAQWAGKGVLPLEEFKKYPLWIAAYINRPPRALPPWDTWAIWQYSSLGQIDGISASVDLNVMKSGTF